MPENPLDDLIKELQNDQQQHDEPTWTYEPQRQETPYPPGGLTEEIRARFQFDWRTRRESLPGYMPEAIQSDMARKTARQDMGLYMNSMGYIYNEAQKPAWDWKNQWRIDNLDPEGKPYNQFGDTLPYGAIEWTPMGNPSYREEGQSIFQGEWNKYWSTMNAPYGENLGEGYRYKTGPQPDAFTEEKIQAKLDEGAISNEQAEELRLIGRQAHGLITDRLKKEFGRVTGEQPGLGTKLGRVPKAALSFWMKADEMPAIALEKRLGAINDIVATAQKELGIHMPYERYDPEANPEWVKNLTDYLDPEGVVAEFRAEQYGEDREYWEAYFEDEAVHTIKNYYGESFVDTSLAAAFGTTFALGHGVKTKNIVEGGPLDVSLESARILYTGIKEPIARAQMVERVRDGEDPIMLAEELENPWSEAFVRTILNPLWLVDFAAHNMRDVFRWTSYANKFLGSNPFVPKAIKAIKAADKIVPEQMADDVYVVASGTLAIDNKAATGRFRKFMDSMGLWTLTSSGKQNRMTQTAGEVLSSITRTAGDPVSQADGIKAVILMASDVDAERKLGLIYASNFTNPQMLYSEAARDTGFLMREMMRGGDGIVDATRFLDDLQVAQELGVEAVTKFVGKKLDNSIEALYPSMTKRIIAHDEAVAWSDAGLELTQQQFNALGDNIPKHIRTAVKFDAGLPGQIKRGINTFAANIYMGYSPGWFSRNIQNNILTSVTDQGIAGMKYWSADSALDNASAWLGQIDVTGFGPRTKMGITDLKHYSQIDLPDDIRKFANQAGDIQKQMGKLDKAKYIPGTDEYKQAQKLKKELGVADLQLKKVMDEHKFLDAGTGWPSLFGPAEAAERMTGANVLSAAGERAMRKQLKVGRALPEGNVLFDAELPDDVFRLFISDIVESKGDVKGAVSRLQKYIKSGESPWVMSGTDFLGAKVTKQLSDHKFMQHYLDVVRDGFAKGENVDTVLGKWRAITDGWDEMAAKVSDDVVTLADDVEGGETIVRTAYDNLQAGIIDEGQVTVNFNYQNLSNASNQNYLGALSKFKTRAHNAKDIDAERAADDLLVEIDRLFNERKAWADEAHRTVEGSVTDSITFTTREEILEEWNKLGLLGEPSQDITKQQFTDIRWRELWYTPDRDKRDALRNLINAEFHDLLEKYPGIVIDKHFVDIADTAFLRSQAYDDVLRLDQVRTALARARKNEQWDYFTRTLAHQYGIPPVVYDGDVVIPQDAKVLDIINENLGTKYTDFAGIPEDDLNKAFMRYRVAEHMRELGLEPPVVAPLGKAAEEAGGVPRMSDELAQYADDVGADLDPGFGERVVWDQSIEDMGAKGMETTDAGAVNLMDEPPKGTNVVHVGDGEEWHRQLVKDYDRDIERGIIVEIDADGMAHIDDPDIMAVDLPDGTIVPDSGILLTSEDFIPTNRLAVTKVKFGDDWHSVRVGEQLPDEVLDAYPGLREYIAGGWEARPATTAAEAVPTRPFVPPLGQTFPTLQRMTAETADGVKELSLEVERLVRASWGKKLAGIGGDAPMTPARTKMLLEAVKGWGDDAYKRVADARLVSRQVAYAARDYALHSYPEKYGWDIALSYIYPYEFWHTRTYAKWAQRVFTDPAVVAAYSNYRTALEKIHAGSPEWLKYSLNTGELLGIETDNPVYIKPQASLDPIQGLTGTDFNDPQKRVDWLSTTVDDMSKWGPAPWTPFNYVVAAALWAKGETVAAGRWAGRLIPQTKPLKGLMSMAGINIRHPLMREGLNEFDPATLAFNAGIEPYEYNKILVELGGMVESGEIDAAQQIDALESAEGEIWELAHERAIRRRAPGDLSSWGLGLSFRGRNKTDQDIDDFYRDMFRVMGQKDTQTEEEYRDEMGELFNGREWAQGLLMGRKRGLARDEALAYNAFSRLEPGKMGDVLENVPGMVPYHMVQEFLNTKGDAYHEWSEDDQIAFMTTVKTILTVADLPTDATKEQWQEGKDGIQKMRVGMDAWAGGDEGIWDLISGFYAIKHQGDIERWTQAEIYDAQQDYLDLHPQVEMVQDQMAAMKLKDDEMAPYYSGLEGLERYGQSLLWDILVREHGAGIFDEWNDYHNAMLVWDGNITQFEQDHEWVTTIKEQRNAMVAEADAQIEGFEFLNPVVLAINEAYSDMWESRAKTIRHETGTTLDKLWQGYWDIPEENKIERRAYYRENEEGLELGKTLKEEGLAHIEATYKPEQIALYEQWDTITDARWDLYRYGYKDVLREEGFEDSQFEDYDEYNSMFKLKNEKRDAIFDASEGLTGYSDTKRELALLTAKETINIQKYLPSGPGTRLRQPPVGGFGNIAQGMHDYLSGQAGKARTYYDYTWDDWVEQIDEPVMNLIRDYVVDGYDVPEKLFDNLERVADRIGIMTPEMLFEMIQASYR